MVVNIETLDEYNKQRQEAFVPNSNEPCPNGIACSRCGVELMDRNPMYVLASYPPQKEVYCPSCGFCGYRVA